MDYKSERSRNDQLVRLAKAITQAVAGIFIIVVGAIMLDKNNFGLARIKKFVEDRDPILMMMFGGICILYGVWRLYRAWLTYKEAE